MHPCCKRRVAWLLVATWHMSSQSQTTCQGLGNDKETHWGVDWCWLHGRGMPEPAAHPALTPESLCSITRSGQHGAELGPFL